MKRRQLLKALSAFSVSLAMPPLMHQANSKEKSAINIKRNFNQILNNDSQFIGLANIEKDFTKTPLLIEGKVPQGLAGQFYRNGPAKYERGNIRYQHLFEGDGMVQAFNIANEQIHHQGKFVQTPKFRQEQTQQKFLYSGADTQLVNSLPVNKPDTINTANTNVIAVNDDLWALWEAGSASVLNRESLEFKKFHDIGKNTHYANKLTGMPFSAHPKIDPNGDIWNFGLNYNGSIVLYHLSAHGQAKNVALINANYHGRMLHDFLITDKHILLILPSLFADANNPRFFERIKFSSNTPMRVLVIDKNTLQYKREYELPIGFAFHFGNAWENRNGDIQFDASLYSDAGIIQQLSRIMQGSQEAFIQNKITLFTLRKNGKTQQQNINTTNEFPRVCAHLTGIKNRYLYFVGQQGKGMWSNTVNSFDINTGKQDKYYYGDDFIAEEHIPVCPTGIEGLGYLIGTALHFPSKRTCLNIFNVANISDGPITRAWLPYHLPLGFHGNFYPKKS